MARWISVTAEDTNKDTLINLDNVSAIQGRTIFFVGGGAMLYGLDELIRRETQIPTALATDALSCVALGCGKALDAFSRFDGKAMNTRFTK